MASIQFGLNAVTLSRGGQGREMGLAHHLQGGQQLKLQPERQQQSLQLKRMVEVGLQPRDAQEILSPEGKREGAGHNRMSDRTS